MNQEQINNFASAVALDYMKELDKRGFTLELQQCTEYFARVTKWQRELDSDEAQEIISFCQKILNGYDLVMRAEK